MKYRLHLKGWDDLAPETYAAVFGRVTDDHDQAVRWADDAASNGWSAQVIKHYWAKGEYKTKVTYGTDPADHLYKIMGGN